MSEPSQGQRSAVDGANHAQVSVNGDANGAARRSNGAARLPAEAPPLDALELFTDLAAACVPAFCDGLQFDLAADGVDAVSARFPLAADGAGTDEGATAKIAAAAGELTSPGRIVIAVRSELAPGEPAVVATVICTWQDESRPTEADALVARLLADQAVAKLRLQRLEAALQKQLTRATNLEEALATNREIGQAIGILMATDHVTAEQAFEQLRTASQHTHRKLREIAADVAETGALTLPAESVHADQVTSRPSPDGRPMRRAETSPRVQRRTRGGQPISAVPDEA
jgi:hypothetical protein